MCEAFSTKRRRTGGSKTPVGSENGAVSKNGALERNDVRHNAATPRQPTRRRAKPHRRPPTCCLGYVLTRISALGGCCPPNVLLRASRPPEYPDSLLRAADRCGIGRRRAARCRSR